MNLGIKISLPGFDVSSASPEQCAIDSNYDTFKVDSHSSPPHFGIIKITFNNNPPTGTSTIFSMPHNYSHRPSLLTHFDTGPNFPATAGGVITGHIALNSFNTSWIECNVTDTQMKVDVRNNGSTDFSGAALAALGDGIYPTVMTLRFYIFAEDGD